MSNLTPGSLTTIGLIAVYSIIVSLSVYSINVSTLITLSQHAKSKNYIVDLQNKKFYKIVHDEIPGMCTKLKATAVCAAAAAEIN